MNLNKVILSITSVILIILGFYSFSINSAYKWDLPILIFVMLMIYYLRELIHLHPFHYLLLGIFVIFHNLGVFGFYSYFPLGMEYDFYMHTSFGLISSLILFRLYNKKEPYEKKIFNIFAILIIILGMSAFHELFEYGGAIILGEGEGMLAFGMGDLDPWDTQKDMRNNLVGGLIGITIYTIYSKDNGSKVKKKIRKKYNKKSLNLKDNK